MNEKDYIQGVCDVLVKDGLAIAMFALGYIMMFLAIGLLIDWIVALAMTGGVLLIGSALLWNR